MVVGGPLNCLRSASISGFFFPWNGTIGACYQNVTVCHGVSFCKNVKFFLEQATATKKGSRGMVYSFVNLGARFRWVVNATSRALYTQK